MKRFIYLTCFLALLGGKTFGQTDAYSKDVLHFLEINGSKQTFSVVVKQLMMQFKMMKSDVPEAFWTKFENEVLSASMEDLYAELVPIYKNHFTHAEIKEIIKFYESPVGKKMAKETPAITQESMGVGQKWGKMIGEKVQKALKEKGY